MKLPRLTARRIILLVGILVIALGQAGSSAFQRYLRCQSQADDFASSEGLYRQKGRVCEELAPKLREVAALASEMAKSASSEFERRKWLEMARSEEEKANELDREALRLMSRADELASRADSHSRLAWRPWLPESE
jgi:hypothetical protein